jgi:hypothetical protein
MKTKNRPKQQKALLNAQPASTALKVVSYVCLAVGLCSFWGILQFRYFDNTINGLGFFFLFAFVGLLLSVPFYILIYQTVPDLKQKRQIGKQWSSNLACLGLGFFFLIPGLASYINRTNLAGQPVCNIYNIVRKGSSSGRGREYYFFVVIENAEQRLTVYKPLWDKYNEKQEIHLCIQRGILGYDNIQLPD